VVCGETIGGATAELGSDLIGTVSKKDREEWDWERRPGDAVRFLLQAWWTEERS